MSNRSRHAEEGSLVDRLRGVGPDYSCDTAHGRSVDHFDDHWRLVQIRRRNTPALDLPVGAGDLCRV